MKKNKTPEWQYKPSLASVPHSERTEKNCFDHLINSYANIVEIPEKIRIRIITSEIGYEIVKENFLFLEYIPRNIRNKDFMYQIWKDRNNIHLFDIHFFLKFSPKSLFTREFCNECISIFPTPSILSFFPKRRIDGTLLSAGIRANPKLLKYSFDNGIKISSKVIEIAVSKCGSLLKHIPESRKNSRLSCLGIKNNPSALRYAVFK